MSLYLGKDNVGNSVLHTTRASLGESVMKAGVNEYTTFHSSLPYVQLVKIIPVSHSKTGTFNGQWYTYDFNIGLPAEAIAILLPIDRLLDTVRTVVNVQGDMMISVVVDRHTRDHDEQIDAISPS